MKPQHYECIFVAALVIVLVGVGLTFGWWLGAAAAAACWLLAPQVVV